MDEGWERAVRPMRRIGHAIEAHATIGSTNDRARDLLAGAAGDGQVVVADEQTAGRGRRGRRWLSPPGATLAVSVALRPSIGARDAWQLGPAVALAAADACRPHAAIVLKWPNDLLAADGRKVGGILVETMVEGARLAGAVVGIGINANWPRASMPPEIAPDATSLSDLAGGPVDRVALLGHLLDALEREVAALEAGASPIDRYRDACATLGTLVTVATPEGSVEGRAVDLDATGSLVVDAADGRHVIASGEVLRLRREVAV